MRKDFLEKARRHYDIMQQMYSLNTKNSVENSKIYDETEFLDKSYGKMPQIIVKDSNVSDEIENLLVTFGDKKICVLNFAIVDSLGNQKAKIDSLRTSKEGGSYSSTITLEISSV